MRIVLGEVKEIEEGKFSMVRAIELPVGRFHKIPKTAIKGILYHAYEQLLENKREAEIQDLEKLAQT